MPRMRYTMGQMMITVAVIAVGMGLARWDRSLGFISFLGALGIPVLTRSHQDGTRYLRADARRVGYCYLGSVVGPAVCLVLDPLVFRGDSFSSGSMLQAYQYECYSFIGLEMAVFTLWLSFAKSLGSVVSGLIGGALWMGAIFALGLGLALLPLSLIGLFVLIGALGFTPLLTAYVFFLQGRYAASRSRRQGSIGRHLALQLTGASLAAGLPILVHLVSRR